MLISPLETPAIQFQEPEDRRTPEPEEIEIKVQRNEMESLVERQKAQIEAQSAELVEMRAMKEKYVKWHWEHMEQIDELKKKD
jgi:hypothetical protein